MNNSHLERLFYAHYCYINLAMCVHLMDGAAIEAAFEETTCGSTVHAAAWIHPVGLRYTIFIAL